MVIYITSEYSFTNAQLDSDMPTNEPSAVQNDAVSNFDNQEYLTSINMTEEPREIAVDTSRNKLYVTTLNSTNVHVINGTSNEMVDTIMINDTLPEDIEVNPNLDRVYVAISSVTDSPGILHVIEGKENKIIANLTIDNQPTDIAVDPKTNKIYVASYPNRISVIDGERNEELYNFTVHDFPAKLAINAEKSLLYVMINNDDYISVNDEVAVINSSDYRPVTNITIPNHAHDIDVEPEKGTIYVTNDSGNRISVINGNTSKVETTIRRNFTDVNEAELAVDNNPSLIYVTSSRNTVSVINGTSNTYLTDVTLGGGDPLDLAINPRTNMTYIPLSTGSIISVINGTSDGILVNQVTAREEHPGLEVERNPIDIAVNPETNMIYVIYSTSSVISVIDGNTNNIINTIQVGSLPSAIDVNSVTNTIYLVSREVDSVIAIDGATNRLLTNVTIEENPLDLVINPDTNIIYTINSLPYKEEQEPTEETENIDEERSIDNKSITAISGATNTKIGTFDLSADDQIALDMNTNLLYAFEDEIVREIAAPSSGDRDRPFHLKPDFINEISGLPILFTTDIAVNPNTNLLYVVRDFGEGISEIDPYTGTVMNNYTIAGTASDTAVNPETNMVYTTNRGSDTVSIINATSKATMADVSLGQEPRAVAINPENNKIYVANTESSTVSIINGRTNKMEVTVNIDINPANAGYIECNGQEFSGNSTAMYDTGTFLECQGKANTGFQFSSWSGDLASSTPSNTNDQTNTLFDSLFGSWLNPSNGNDNYAKTTFTVSKYGALSANFINPVQITIPWELLAGIILGPIVGWSIPSIVGWINSKRDVGRLNYYHKQIASLYNDGKLDKNDIKVLDNLRSHAANEYSKGKINEKNYESLGNEMSVLYDRIFTKEIDALLTSHSVLQITIHKQLDEIRNEVECAYSEGKLNEKHYVLLSKAVSDLRSKDK